MGNPVERKNQEKKGFDVLEQAVIDQYDYDFRQGT